MLKSGITNCTLQNIALFHPVRDYSQSQQEEDMIVQCAIYAGSLSKTIVVCAKQFLDEIS